MRKYGENNYYRGSRIGIQWLYILEVRYIVIPIANIILGGEYKAELLNENRSGRYVGEKNVFSHLILRNLPEGVNPVMQSEKFYSTYVLS